MATGLDQVGNLAANPTGLPGMSDHEREVAALEDEIQYQAELRQQQEFAYGKALAQAGRSPLPDERQLHYLFDTQPTTKDLEDHPGWDENTFDETNILRHIQFGMYDPAEKARLMREYADIQVLRQQAGKERVAMNAAKRLYMSILSSKGTIHDGHPPAIEIMLNPVSKTDVTQHQAYDQGRKPVGFWSFLGKGK
jgi:hypothetical protein